KQQSYTGAIARTLPIILPPTIEEQTAIATALSDADALITALEKLIAKKKAIKQGVMQKLLQPKEGWEMKRLDEIGVVIRGASPRPQGDKRFYGGNVPRLMVEDVTRDGKYVTPRVDFLTEAGSKLSRPCKKGTLTIVCSGNVGIPSILAVDACIHDGFLAVIDIKKGFSIDFLYHNLSTLRNQLNSSATHGGIFTNLTTSSIKEFAVAFPDYETQE
ncbi:MAG: restriction endonuclease subunit S, partial [Flammeovirgaceae bacterium]